MQQQHLSPTTNAPLPPDLQGAQAGMVLAVDKPLHWTSFDVVKKLRARWQLRKVGHAGTLDPLATGLLIICTGKATKSIDQYQAMEKVYQGTLVLGKTTPSIDLETPFDSTTPWDHLQKQDLLDQVPSFTGNLLQVPPIYSAIKTQGKRAYKSARKGQNIKLAPRPVHIHEFVLTAIELPIVNFEVTCSKGTYIRSLVRDFGQQLGVGAYLSTLRRTRIGPFHVEQAYDLNEPAGS